MELNRDPVSEAIFASLSYVVNYFGTRCATC